MRRVLASLMAVIAIVMLAPAESRAAARPATGPSPQAIHRALARAQRSSYLWATVNICEPEPQHGGLIGVRGEMPALGFGASLSMTIQLNQYLPREKRYVAVKAATASRTVTIGRQTRGVHQSGAEFPYATDTGMLDATVTFTWTRGGRVLDQVTRTTTGGHPSAAFGVPPHTSTASCQL